ncbi:MAG: transglutaminase domain-containing protein [Deltaproteobacteria bacterium]|nr:transglutaminase domain-containing protein [Deltaproteobacteria bacterium]
MKKSLAVLFFWLAALAPVHAENYLLNGGQESVIEYQLIQQVVPKAATKRLVVSFVTPNTFESPTYVQRITDMSLEFSPKPTRREKSTDERGNVVEEAFFDSPAGPIQTTLTLTAKNSVKLSPLRSTAPFPLANTPPSMKPYLSSTAQVDVKHQGIAAKARELTRSSTTQFDATQKILTWVVDHMSYVLTPQSYEATYSFGSGKGNCQNYSHLAAALMRAVGIPARIVNGVTLSEPYDIDMGRSVLTLKMAQGRHSWIEVWFPDLGWMPFDPQNTQLYVSNRFIRIEVGVDNEETSHDGLIRWSTMAGADGRPEFRELIQPAFSSDKVAISGQKAAYGPQALLLGPKMDAVFAKVEPPPQPLPPVIPPPEVVKKMVFDTPFEFGNVEFPENMDFLATKGPTEKTGDNDFSMRRNFVVETAEYVTTLGRQYSQAFVVEKPMKLTQLGLALHKFGGEGQLWVEVFKDTGGMPGEVVATSEVQDLGEMPEKLGYFWVDFSFGKDGPVLSPGTYWLGMGFAGSPIINWFYRYGRPVGPRDGTRYKTIYDTTWSRSMAYEFNYRVRGLVSR